ncbi:MAG: PAS domain S-box protein, partial [Bacteroidota bacterium]
MLINTDYQLLEFNEVFARALKDHAQIKLEKGMNLLDCYDLTKEERRLWQERYQAAFLGKEQAFIEERVLDGHNSISSIKLFPIRSGRNINRVSIFIEDITQLKDAETQLKQALLKSEEQTRQLQVKGRLLHESESLLKAVINHLPLVVFWKDLQLRFIGGNRYFMEMLGFSKEEEFLGKNDYDLTYSGIEAELFRKDDLQVIQEKKARQDVEEAFVDAKGEINWFNTSKIPLFDEYEEVFGVLVLISNVTERKKNQEALQQALSRAEEASRAKSLFLSTMSHEIRSPLNAVIGLSHLLLQENPRPDQLEDLNILKFSAENLLALVNDILDYNKIEANKIELENIEFRLPSFLQSVYNSFLPKA